MRLASLARIPYRVADLGPELYVRGFCCDIDRGSYSVSLCSRAFSPSAPPSLRLYFPCARLLVDVLFERNVVCVASL